ncbi:MAG: hypothetical protein H7832_06420 [Magnetococcus sp. DMHC-6]
MDELDAKYDRLHAHLHALGRVLVAFSGGVDSSFLLLATVEAGVAYLAVTTTSPTMPASDLSTVVDIVAHLGANHRFIDSGEMAIEGFVRNGADRCFFCKSDLFQRLTSLARTEGFAVVLESGVSGGQSFVGIGVYKSGNPCAFSS